jgi:hypothetical protein
VVVVNKVFSSAPVTLSLAGFAASGPAARWQLTSANAISRVSDVSPSGASLSFTAPAQSITLVVVPSGTPSPSPTPTPTPAPTPSPTPTPTPAPGGQSTYGNNGAPWSLTRSAPLRIQAENFDLGGEGVAYHDADTANSGSQYRSGGVDIQATSDGGGHNVGWVNPGEWLEFTVDVASAGSYDLTLRTARQPSGTSLVRVLVGGVDKTGDLAVPSTGSWQSWTNVTRTRVSLAAGRQVLRIAMAGGSFNVNWIEVKPSA